jgi:protein involved in polysaccharide export with SLBB domain
MKSLIQIAVPTVCCLMLAAVTTSIWFNQQTANAALATMSQRMDDLNRSLSARSPEPNVATPSNFGRSVYITGTPVSRPGQYSVPAEGLSLRRLLAASGVNLKFVKDVDVRHSNKYGQPGNERLSAAAILDPAGPDIELLADDLVTIFEAKP